MSTRRALALGMTFLVVVDLVGGIWAATSGVNSWGGAWGNQALLAAPAPMIVGQVVATWLAVAFEKRWAAIPAILLALACLVSAISGFFDGGLGNEVLSTAQSVFQVCLLVVTAAVGVLAVLRARQLLGYRRS